LGSELLWADDAVEAVAFSGDNLGITPDE